MLGTIHNFIEEKKYGFILGADNEKYFFHFNDFKGEQVEKGLLVSFETGLNSKGYFAKKIKKETQHLKYDIPEEIKTYKDNFYLKHYEILEDNSFKIHSESRDLSTAYNNLILLAKVMHANALIEFQYFKSTGSESGTGYGTHYYTIHHYTAVPVLLGKKSLNGTKDIPAPYIENFCSLLKEKGIKETKKSKIKFFIILFIILLINIGYFKIPFIKEQIQHISYVIILISSFVLLFTNKIKYTDNIIYYR